MEHAVPSENFQRENGTTFSEVPHFPEIFQWNEPKNHVPFTTQLEFPESLGKCNECNELNRGHQTFFSQSQDDLRTKELEFVHFGPIINERLAVKSCLFPSTKRRLIKYSLLGATNFEN